jgi:hypothetical protein
MVWVIVLIIKTISMIIPTKHTYGKDHMCLWRTFEKKKKMHGTSHYIKYSWGNSLLMGYLCSFVGAIFFVCSIPLGFSHHLTPLPRTHTHTCVCAMYAISIDILFVLPCLTSGVHTKSTFEKGDLLGFGLKLIVIWEFGPCL